MTVAKVFEISAESKDSFEDSIRQGIARASETVEDIRGAWVKEQSVVIDKGKIKVFRVDLKVTFILK